jgi:hypothetical protein
MLGRRDVHTTLSASLALLRQRIRKTREPLDERRALRTDSSEAEAGDACATKIVADTSSQCDETDDITRFGRKGALRRFGSLAVLRYPSQSPPPCQW